MNADLHIHTTASDGALTPSQVVRLAQKETLRGIAITDHDAIEGIEEALKEGELINLKVVPGIEVSTQLEQEEIHILGYFIDYQADFLQSKLNELRMERIMRNKKIIKKLNDLGYKLEWEEVLALAGNGSVGRPHIALALQNRGYIQTMEEAFHKLLNRGAPAFVPRKKLTPKEGIEMIHRAKGVAVLAHPGLLKDKSLAKSLVPLGLDGIEVFYPLHSGEDVSLFKSLCKSYGLIATGGSDFHGMGSESKTKIGAALVPYHTIIDLEKVKEKRLE